MDYIKAKTLIDRIDIFCKTADVNHDGKLSYIEIKELCVICLSKYIKDETIS